MSVDRAILAAVCCALAGCETTIENGPFRARIRGDATHMVITGPGVTFDATGLSHSRPTAAAMRGTAHVVGAMAAAALPFASGTTTAVKAAAVLPALVPSFRTEPQPLR